MNAKRRKTAPDTPQKSTAYWYFRGTWKTRKIIAKTKRLSNDSDFSTTNPVRKVIPAWELPREAYPHHQMTPPNNRPKPIQNTLHPTDSQSDGVRTRRWKRSMSTKSNAATKEPNASQCQSSTSNRCSVKGSGKMAQATTGIPVMTSEHKSSVQ